MKQHRPGCDAISEAYDRAYSHCNCPEVQEEQTMATVYDLAELQSKVEALQRFKDWCHTYLDSHGVPHHPPGPHGAEGCRIGDRMDWLMARLKEAEVRTVGLKAEVDRLQAMVQGLTDRVGAQSELLSRKAEAASLCRLCGGKGSIDRPVICGPDVPEEEMARMARIADEEYGPIPCPSCAKRKEDAGHVP